jgi:DNA polymerase elongation subunit (family B)
MARALCEERYNDVVSFVYGDTDSLFLKTVEKLSVADAIK